MCLILNIRYSWLNIQTRECSYKVSKLRRSPFLSLSDIALGHLMKNGGGNPQGYGDKLPSSLSALGRNRNWVSIHLLHINFLLVENAAFSASMIPLLADESSSHPSEQDPPNAFQLSPSPMCPWVKSFQFKRKCHRYYGNSYNLATSNFHSSVS